MKKFIVIVIAALSVAVAVSAISTSADDRCRYCEGRGWNECNMCDGDGWRECPMCNGDGYIEKRDGTKETCASCKGKKVFKCGYCNKGKRQCDACNGTGKKRYVGQ